MDPITIRLAPWMCEELSACEEGAYADSCHLIRIGEPVERQLASHTHIVAHRDALKGKIVIRTKAEAEDVYYAVCSGVFKAKTTHTYRAACRIANLLRPYAEPETVRVWPEPYREPFTGV